MSICFFTNISFANDVHQNATDPQGNGPKNVAPAKMIMPPITGQPVIDAPAQLLLWPQEELRDGVDMTLRTSNRVDDLHARFGDCDFVLSSVGNFYMALSELWYNVFLLDFAPNSGPRNWFYTTTPLMALQQIKKNDVTFGNLSLKCMPNVVIGPTNLVNELTAQGHTIGKPVPVLHSRGNVLLVKKGNPKKIKTIWDLGRSDVQVVTPNPTETTAFTIYTESIYAIAAKDAQAPEGWNADRLFNAIFNNSAKTEDSSGAYPGNQEVSGLRSKWLSSAKAHHREIPWSVAYGHADVGILFYHLARYVVQTFPDLFEIVPLGGTIADPQPLPGNKISAPYAIRIKGNWTPVQQAATEKFMNALGSDAFTNILIKDGLTR